MVDGRSSIVNQVGGAYANAVLRALIRLVVWFAVAALSMAAIVTFGIALSNEGDAVQWLWAGVSVALAGVGFLGYRWLLKGEAPEPASSTTDSGEDSTLGRRLVEADAAAGGLLGQRPSLFYWFPLAVIGSVVYLTLLFTVFVAINAIFELFGVAVANLSGPAVVLGWLAFVVGVIGPMVVIVVGYRWTLRTMRRRFPNFMRYLEGR